MNLFRRIARCGPWRRLLPACLLVLANGCALGEYEARMDAQRKRLDVLDQENRFLNEPIAQPKTENKEGEKSPTWPFEVYVRLPKDFGMSVNATLAYNAQPLCRYSARDGYAAFVAAGLIPEKKDDKGKETKPAPGEWPVERFRANVHGALRELCLKDRIAGFPSLEGASFTKMTKIPIGEQGEARPALEFSVLYFKAGDFRFDFYFHQQSNRQVAIVFQYPLSVANDENLKKGIDMSLATTAFGSEAANRRNAFQNRRHFKR